MSNPFAVISESANHRPRTVRAGTLTAAIAATFCALSLSESQAGTATTTFAVSATITGAACTSISATALAFGSIAPTASASSTSTVTINCANGTAYSISAVGIAPACTGSSFLGNTMYSSTNTSASSPYYQLFKDSAHSVALAANTTCGPLGTALTGTGTGVAQTLTIYGLLYGSTGSTASSAGNYTDTATVTVTF